MKENRYFEMWKIYRDIHNEFWKLAENAPTIEEMKNNLKRVDACYEVMNFYEKKIAQGWE